MIYSLRYSGIEQLTHSVNNDKAQRSPARCYCPHIADRRVSYELTATVFSNKGGHSANHESAN